jgi:hypothetical protein
MGVELLTKARLTLVNTDTPADPAEPVPAAIAGLDSGNSSATSPARSTPLYSQTSHLLPLDIDRSIINPGSSR